MYDLKNKNVLVTGGASFIGSHLVDKLVEKGAKVSIVDNLSSGRIENLKQHKIYTDVGIYSVYEDTLEPRFPVDDFSHKYIKFWKADLRKQEVAERVTRNADVVFHLAADHGGRGYVDTHQYGPSINLMLDGMLFRAAHNNGVDKVVYASSGCVYPNLIQQDTEQELYLQEDDVGPPHDSDNMYGWAKLMAEKTLESYYNEVEMKSVSLRYFTVYGGKRMKPDHALCAMAYRAYAGESPFTVWGTGGQIRNWTRVEDIVRGTILAAERIDDATPINLGIEKRISVKEAARKILEYVGRKDDEIKYLPDMPTGPLNRVCDNSRARRMLGWKPGWSFEEGLKDLVNGVKDGMSQEKLENKIDNEGFFMER